MIKSDISHKTLIEEQKRQITLFNQLKVTDGYKGDGFKCLVDLGKDVEGLLIDIEDFNINQQKKSNGFGLLPIMKTQILYTRIRCLITSIETVDIIKTDKNIKQKQL